METNKEQVPAVGGLTDKTVEIALRAAKEVGGRFEHILSVEELVNYTRAIEREALATRPSVDLSGLTDDQIDTHIIKSGVMDKAWPTQVGLHSFARAIEREVLATRSSVDLSGLTRYAPMTDQSFYGPVGNMGAFPTGEYVKLADVQSLLSTLPAHQAVAAEGVKVPEAIRSAGAKMANTMFNLAQRAGDLIDGDLVASMDAMRKEWDAAIRAVPPVSAGEQPSQQLRQTGDPDGSVREWMEAHGYGNQTVGFALETLQSRIEAKDRELSSLATAHLARQAQAATAGELVHVGTLSVYEDKDATFGHAYDISTNMAGHKALQVLDGAELYAAKPGSLAAPAQGSAPQARFPADLLPGAQSADDLRLRAASQAERAAVPTLWQKFLTASIAFAKAHIACDEHERTWGTDQEDQSEGAHEAYDQCTRRYNETKAELVGAYVLANAAAPVAQEADQMGGAQVDIGDSPDLRNIAEIVRPSDQSLHLRFMSTRSCSFFHRYIEEAREAQRNGSKAQTTLAASSESVDTPEFYALIGTWGQHAWGNCADEEKARKALAALIAHIESLIAARVACVRKDAERYRWMRNRDNSLETRQYDKGVFNGPSCYHEVEGIRELKSGEKLDAAIDAAMSASPASGSQEGGA